MLISHKYKYIYIHIPKTGGISIKDALQGTYDKVLSKRIMQHATLSEVERLIESKRFNRYFKFCFIRNPWDWYVSMFHYIKNTPHKDHKIAKNRSFKEFLEWVRDVGSKRKIAPVGWWYREDMHVSKEQRKLREKLMPSYRQQIDYAKNLNGVPSMDFYGSFESLQKDFDYICDRVNIPHRILPKLNITSHDHYSKHYDNTSLEIVKQISKSDIEIFQYDFGENHENNRSSI